MKSSLILLCILILILVGIQVEYNRTTYNLPKIVWTHWNSKDPPVHVKQCVERMRTILPDWQVNFITTDEYVQSLESIPSRFKTLGLAHQADWIRLDLLNRYGGCWIDSGVILNQSINSLYRECAYEQADVLVFKIKQLQTNTSFPVGENWFIMAPSNSPVISAWLDEYTQAIEMGFKSYKHKIKKEGVDLQNLMKDEEDVYLTQHGCFQKVIQQRILNARILYHNAEDTMFKIQSKDCDWNEDCIKKKLEDLEYCRNIPYIKLRGTDRKNVNIEYLLNTL